MLKLMSLEHCLQLQENFFIYKYVNKKLYISSLLSERFFPLTSLAHGKKKCGKYFYSNK